MNLTREEKNNILLGIFIAGLVAGNLLGNKITNFFMFTVSVGIIAYPLTFLVSNILNETQGSQLPKNYVLVGCIAVIATMLLTIISIKLPAATRFTFNAEYVKVFSSTLRIMVASVSAFVVAQILNIHIFSNLKERTFGKHAWLRYNAAVIFSLLVDSVLFYFIAFYGATPKFTASYILLKMTPPYWLIKILFSLISTPLFYAGAYWLKTSIRPEVPPIRVPVTIKHGHGQRV